MDYQVLDPLLANNLKNRSEARLLKTIPFNLSKVFLLPDTSYLITPLNPFGNSLHVQSEELLNLWIANEYFPSNDEVDKFYWENKQNIDNLLVEKEKLKQVMFDYLSKYVKSDQAGLNNEKIDTIHNILKTKKKFKQFRLNFIIVVGDYLIDQFKNENLCWGRLINKQLLNPIINLILISQTAEPTYYNLQDSIIGKKGYHGIQLITYSIKNNLTRKPNEIEQISILQ